MTEFKKGDWVYDEIDGDVFMFHHFDDDGDLEDENDVPYYKSRCHLLAPLDSSDDVKVGDKVAVIEYHEKNGISPGEISTVKIKTGFTMLLSGDKIGYLPGELARLPDCAQEKRDTGAISSIKWEKATINWDDIPDNWVALVNGEEVPIENFIPPSAPDPRPCPHPEWEGIWDRGIESPVRIEWDGFGFLGNMCRFNEGWHGPIDANWVQIEPAPKTATAVPIRQRPQKHGEIKTPWNPWEV